MTSGNTYRDEATHLVTGLLGRISAGENGAANDLMEVIYSDLRRIAQRFMDGERPGHTLQATSLVNEAWLRLRGDIADGDWTSRRHFFGAAANAMRRVLIDHSRTRGRQKRGGNRVRVDLRSAADLMARGDREDVLAIDEAVRRLEEEDERVGQVVRLRFYAGLGVDDVASALGVSRRTVLKDWAYARAWLYSALGDGGLETSEP